LSTLQFRIASLSRASALRLTRKLSVKKTRRRFGSIVPARCLSRWRRYATSKNPARMGPGESIAATAKAEQRTASCPTWSENSGCAGFAEFNDCSSRYPSCPCRTIQPELAGIQKGCLMLSRFTYGALLVLVSLMASGCCFTGGACGVGGCGDCGIGSVVHHSVASINCRSGCGDIYWDEWRSDPPGCNSCDRGPVCQGGWCGECWDGCSSPFGWLAEGWRHLWGYRYCPYDCDGNCSACRSAEPYYESIPAPPAQPTPARKPASRPAPKKTLPAPEPDVEPGPVTKVTNASPLRQAMYQRTVPRSNIRR
jgi:hypothetical protein